jgi:hypothetical protein
MIANVRSLRDIEEMASRGSSRIRPIFVDFRLGDNGLTSGDQRPDYAARELDRNMTPQGWVTCCASQARTLRRALLKIRS